MDKQAIKAFLEKPYPGWKDFMQGFVVPLFESADIADQRGANALNPDLLNLAKRSGISEVRLLAEVSALPAEFNVYDVTVSDRVCLQRNRVTVSQLVRKIVGQGSAFMVFHYKDDQSEWRLSFCQKIADAASNAKRHTFLLGEGQNVRTVTANFVQLRDTLTEKGCLEDADLIKCFDVEALSKEFFAKYKKFYEKFVDYASKHDLKQLYKRDEKAVRDYIKKMMGRLVFLQFLQKKGWLGVPKGKAWGEGDRQFLQNLFKAATPKQKDAFLDEILEHIFFHALNDSSRADGELFDTKVKAYGSDGKVKVPYLNGGLFECDQEDDCTCAFPKAYFSNPDDAENNPGLLDFFSQYNFTIDENDPTEAEVGVDPEMLSCIFENLLEDNKDKGAYYTPKAIVEYMCRESLTAYLQTDAKDTDKEKIAAFVKSHDAEPLSKSLAKSIDGKLRKVKICDPAIGSGAFPMGLLRELQLCRTALEDETKSAAEIKKEIIQNNIYGVDIEKGAVDIARLRFWLSLVVDEPTPAALPNLDFKIMQGNSLLESYKGVDLSGLLTKKVTRKPGPKSKQTYVPMEFVFDSTNAQDKIAKLIRDYFEAGSTERKKGILHSVDNEVRCYLRDSGVELCDEILCFQNDKFFLWHTWFNDVFTSGGYDIVIANPPYIRELDNKSVFTAVNEAEFGRRYHCGKMDYWFYFLHKALEIAKNDSVINFITSRYWLKSTGAKKLVRHLDTEASFAQIVDIGSLKVFDNVVGNHMIALYRKNCRTDCLYRLVCDDVGNITRESFQEERVIARSHLISSRDLTINVEDAYELPFMDRLRNFVSPVPLFKVTQGIVENPSCLNKKCIANLAEEGIDVSRFNPGDEVFVISETRVDGMNLTPVEKRLLKPYHSPSDVGRYWHVKECGKRIIYSTRETIASISNYPNLKKHLEPYKVFMDRRRETQKGTVKWFQLHWPRTAQVFEGEKLIYPQMCAHPTFTYVGEPYYVNMATNVIVAVDPRVNLKTLLGIFNSRLGLFWIENHAKKRGCGFDVSVSLMNSFPVAEHFVGDVKIASIVDKILAEKAKDAEADTSELESQIDTLVYDLYGLTEEEREIVKTAEPF